MKESTIGIGMIGAGGIAKSRHLPNLLKLKDVKLVAVANRNIENAQQAAEEFGFEKVYEQWTDVIDDPNVQAVFICTPPYMHAEMTLYALEKGKHVFSQARMAMDLQDAQSMIEADNRSKLTTMLCPPPHYMGVEAYVLEQISQGLIGQVRHVVLSHPTDLFLNPDLPLHWRQRKDLQGINILDVGIMGEVMSKWFGSIQQVHALAKTWVSQRKPDSEGKREVELPDSCTILGEFANGATLTALFSGSVKGGISQMRIHGSLGTITCYPFAHHIDVNTGQGEERIEIADELIKEWSVEEDFIKAIKEGKKGYPSFIQGIDYMTFTQSVMESAGCIE